MCLTTALRQTNKTRKGKLIMCSIRLRPQKLWKPRFFGLVSSLGRTSLIACSVLLAALCVLPTDRASAQTAPCTADCPPQGCPPGGNASGVGPLIQICVVHLNGVVDCNAQVVGSCESLQIRTFLQFLPGDGTVVIGQGYKCGVT